MKHHVDFARQRFGHQPVACLIPTAFVLGILFSQLKLFDRFSALFFPPPGKKFWLGWASLLFIPRAFSAKEMLPDPLLAVLAVILIVKLARAWPRMCGPLQLLGRYSMFIWLIHSFFCYYFFQRWVFVPGLSILITVWLLLLSLAASIVAEKIQSRIVLPELSPSRSKSE